MNNDLLDTPDVALGPLQIHTNPRDGQPAFNSSLFSLPALGSLGAAALAGGAVVALPALFGRNADATGARFAVAAAVSVAGIVGFFAHQPRPIEDNIRKNAPARADWQRRVEAVKAENAKRRGSARLVIRAGPVTVADRGAP